MLSKKVADLLNNQVNKELYSAYLYLDFENYYHDKSLEGFANWYHVQVQEEIAHAQLMMQYLQDNDYSVVATSSDGFIEEIELSSATFNIGIQWHAEISYDFDEDSRKIIDYFINICNE